MPRRDYTIEKNVLRRCRGEMYDRDIQLLQFCAATLPPDEFLVHCLNKFGLVAWAAKVCSKSRRFFAHQMSSLYHLLCGRTVSRDGRIFERSKNQFVIFVCALFDLQILIACTGTPYVNFLLSSTNCLLILKRPLKTDLMIPVATLIEFLHWMK